MALLEAKQMHTFQRNLMGNFNPVIIVSSWIVFLSLIWNRLLVIGIMLCVDICLVIPANNPDVLILQLKQIQLLLFLFKLRISGLPFVFFGS